MTWEAILVHDEDYGIGKSGRIPWCSPKDIRMFRELTAGKTLVMGRKTWESLPVRPLPGRKCVVLSRSMPESTEGAIVLRTPFEVEYYQSLNHEDMVVCGGSEIYDLFHDLIEIYYVTVIEGCYYSDSYVPDRIVKALREIPSKFIGKVTRFEEKDDPAMEFIKYIRIQDES